MHVAPCLLMITSFLTLTLADPVAQALPPQQTIVPFATLPACSKQCGKLFDVQGACSPPVVDASNTKTCFCADPRLTPFKTGTTGVCDQAGCPAADLTTIQKWYDGLCGTTNAGTGVTTASSGAAGATDTSTGNSSGSSSSGGGGGGGNTWISTHVKWVIMAVVITVAIIGGWIGAWLLRRRYLRRREREYEMRPPGAPWASGAAGSAQPSFGGGIVNAGGNKEGRSSVLSTPAASKGKGRSRDSYYDGGEKKQKKKWTVSERT